MPADKSEPARAEAARNGQALPDGSYPMRDCAEVRDAAAAYGQAPQTHRADLAQAIRRRNRELGCGLALDQLEDE